MLVQIRSVGFMTGNQLQPRLVVIPFRRTGTGAIIDTLQSSQSKALTSAHGRQAECLNSAEHSRSDD